MRLSTLDIVVLVVYFVAMIGIGFYIKRRASKDLDSYFLAGRSMPWWLLGVSNASAMWDVTGTMWLVYILYAYGIKAIFLPWLWPVFNQIFDAVYMSKWIRRSGVRTGAEWITTRFGDGRGGELSRGVIVLFALVSVVSFIGYAFQGIGKFCSVFLDPVMTDLFGFTLSPNTYGVLLMAITAIYVVAGGMMSVVLTDFAQFILMTISAFVIGGIAIMEVSPEKLYQVTPTGWADMAFRWNISLDWSGLLPALNDRIASEGMATAFGLFFSVMVFKGILVSMAGAAPNYDMQRILASKTPREASLMSAIVSVCLFPRWIMIGGITLLGLVFVTPEFRQMGSNIDFEQVLPYVINNFLPAGMVGVLLAGLLSSFMANFSATVNAGAAYLVNDLYARYVNPKADGKRLVRASYVGSALILVLGLVIGFSLTSINQITQWIVSGLFGGYTAANVLKWHWWRLNGKGYFGGMLVGLVSALVAPVVAPDLHPLYAFPFILVLSLVASVAGSLMTEPVDDETLKAFYRNVRPWGFWAPVREMMARDGEPVEPNRDAPRDFLNIGVGTVWQLTLVTGPLYLIFRDMRGMVISFGLLAVTTIFLKKFWYDRLESDELLVSGGVAAMAPKPVEQAGD